LPGSKSKKRRRWLEKISGRIEVEELYPSWLIFADGFHFSSGFIIARRLCSTLVAAIGLLIALPLLPFIMLAIKLDSSGPILYRQRRVGLGVSPFIATSSGLCVRTQKPITGATWATPTMILESRVLVGFCVRHASMRFPSCGACSKAKWLFVGPRPERPEFRGMVERADSLLRCAPSGSARHHRLGPGPVQVWQYARDAREKLQYDLFYIKNASLGLDLVIMFQTVKIVLLGRGAR